MSEFANIGGSAEIGIVGAGIMGRSLAWRIQLAGCRVTLFDRDVPMPVTKTAEHSAAAYTAAGMLTPNTEWDAPEDVIVLGQRALARWPQFAASLSPDLLLGQGGCWVVAHAQDHGAYQHAQQQLQHLRCIDKGTVRFYSQHELATASEAFVRGENFSQRFSQAMHFSRESWVDPWQLMRLLFTRLTDAGAKWYWQTNVRAIEGHRVTTERASYHFDWVFDTRGCGAAGELKGLRGVRGETLELYAPEVDISALVRLMHPRYAIYLVPRRDGHYLIGATQIESDDIGPISVRSALELLSAAYSLHSGFAEARVVAQRTQCRPCLPDHRPVVQTPRPGLTCINGLYRNGILLAPELAEQALAEIFVKVGCDPV